MSDTILAKYTRALTTKAKQETKTFGPYIKPKTKALFLMQSFSWGSRKVESETKFFFETGFRHQNRRASLGLVYNRTLA